MLNLFEKANVVAHRSYIDSLSPTVRFELREEVLEDVVDETLEMLESLNYTHRKPILTTCIKSINDPLVTHASQVIWGADTHVLAVYTIDFVDKIDTTNVDGKRRAAGSGINNNVEESVCCDILGGRS